mmetsp:Transcript_8747/g.35730  ORF Transcript_8747/g.35730 Transcript_8747/m.35730 type:complete len:201 (-) Transcript_8747:2516-3118(-)
MACACRSRCRRTPTLRSSPQNVRQCPPSRVRCLAQAASFLPRGWLRTYSRVSHVVNSTFRLVWTAGRSSRPRWAWPRSRGRWRHLWRCWSRLCCGWWRCTRRGTSTAWRAKRWPRSVLRPPTRALVGSRRVHTGSHIRARALARQVRCALAPLALAAAQRQPAAKRNRILLIWHMAAPSGSGPTRRGAAGQVRAWAPPGA